MKPDYQTAAIKATETLIQYGINSAPVDPLPILKRIPGVLVLTFEDMSKKAQIERQEFIDMFGCNNQDAVTTVYVNSEGLRYVVTYNRLLSSMIVDRALARELGHIILGHDGSKTEEVRDEEARCFAKHLLIPRPLLHAVRESGIRLTAEAMNNLTGCNDHCIACIRELPGVRVPAELNHQVRDQFMPYITNYLSFQRYAEKHDASAMADLGTYMDGYEE